MSSNNTVTVRILDKEYQVACPPEHEASLTEAARHLDDRMAEIRASGRVVGLDRIAVMAALNLAHDYLTGAATSATQQASLEQRLETLNDRVGNALAQHKQPDL